VGSQVSQHFPKRRSREEYSIHSSLTHDDGIFLSDRSAASAKNFDHRRKTMPRQPLDDFLEKLNVTAVVTRDTDRHHIFLQSSPRDVLCRTIVPEINHFNAMTNKFQIDRVNGTIVTVTDRHGSQDFEEGVQKLKELSVVSGQFSVADPTIEAI
jgi:hypothetical protein